jgi:hypothetical protein
MCYSRYLGVAILASLAAIPSLASAATIALGSSSDTWIRDGFSHAANGADGTLDWRVSFVPYIQFDMSAQAVDTISSATLTVTKVPSTRNDGIVASRFATYGLLDVPGNTLQIWDELADFDPSDATNGLDFRNVGAEHTLNTGDGVDRGLVESLDPEDGTVGVTEAFAAAPGAASGETTITLTGPALVSFLNDRADANGLVTFVFPFEQDGRGAGLASKEHANSDWHPQLDLVFTSFIPEPTSITLWCVASLIFSRRRRSA